MPGDAWLRAVPAAAVLLFAAGVVLQLVQLGGSSKILRKARLLPVISGTAAAMFVMLLPGQMALMAGEPRAAVKAVLVTAQHTFQIFLVNGDYGMFLETAELCPALSGGYYLLLGAFLAFLAPVLTAGAILMMFGSVYLFWRLLLGSRRDMCVFSVLNEQSLALAESCSEEGFGAGNRRRRRRGPVLVFTGVDRSGEDNARLRQKAAEIDALCLSGEIASVWLGLRKNNGSGVTFFVMSEDSAANIKDALALVESPVYGNRENTKLYILTDSEEAELLLSAASEKTGGGAGGSGGGENKKILIRRVNVIRSLVYNYLYSGETGAAGSASGSVSGDGREEMSPARRIFGQAVPAPEGDGKILRILFVGLGKYGSEFLKAYTWFAQMPGYRLELHVVEKDPEMVRRFCAGCPELVSKSGVREDGDAFYTLRFHGGDRGTDVWSAEFEDVIREIGPVSLAHVSLGDDDRNIEASVRLERLLKKYGTYGGRDAGTGPKPLICTVVLNQERLSAAAEENRFLRDHAGSYEICMLGDRKDNYSRKVLVNSPLQEAALDEHMIWADHSDASGEAAAREKFYRHEYYQRSSEAKVIRVKARSDMDRELPGAKEMKAWRDEQIRFQKEQDKNAIAFSGENVTRWLGSLPPEEREKMFEILKLEHTAWNAYMRSEGYVYREGCGKRDDVARVHPDLRPYGELSEDEKLKDI